LIKKENIDEQNDQKTTKTRKKKQIERKVRTPPLTSTTRATSFWKVKKNFSKASRTSCGG